MFSEVSKTGRLKHLEILSEEGPSGMTLPQDIGEIGLGWGPQLGGDEVRLGDRGKRCVKFL